jgi:hypothetical protein
MSLPHTGKFVAEVRAWTICFDGDNWTGSGPGFEKGILPMLERTMRRLPRTHYSCSDIATRVLNDIFGGNWKQIHSKNDTWQYPDLPPGMKD